MTTSEYKLALTFAVSEAIREVRETPSEHLYKRLMGTMDFEAYTEIVRTLVNCNLITVSGSHVIQWVGPVVVQRSLHTCEWTG